MTLTILAEAGRRNGHRYVRVHCDNCNADTEARAVDVAKSKFCKECNPKARRKAEVIEPLRIVPASPWMNDARIVEALVDLLHPPFGRLPYLAPTRVDDICAALGCEPHHVLRSPISIACEWDSEGERIWGRRIAAADLFGVPVQMFHVTTTDCSRGEIAHKDAA